MRPLFVSTLISLCFAGTALAGGEDYLGEGAEGIDISGPVSVDLMIGSATADSSSVAPLVWGLVPGKAAEDDTETPKDTQFLVQLDLCGSWSTVPKALAGKLGAKMGKQKVNGKKVEVATIPELHIGDMVIRNLRAEVKGETMTLGLGTLEEVGSAILPSTGKVEFVPAADAATFVSSKGTTVTYSTVDGKYFHHGNKVMGDGQSCYVTGSVMGHEGDVFLSTTSLYSAYGAEVEVEEELRIRAHATANGSIEVAGFTTIEGRLLRHEGLKTAAGLAAGQVGYGDLYAVDLAIDPANATIALKAADDVVASAIDPSVIIADAKDTFDKAEAKAEDATEEAETETETAEDSGDDKGDSAAVARHTAYADVLWTYGKVDEALEHYQAASEEAGDNCKAHLDYGTHLIDAGRPRDAIKPLRTAGNLWDRWYAQDLETRTDVKEGKSKSAEFSIAQPAACHVAWGELARARASLGEVEAVAKIYDEHLDLDPMVAQIYGMALLADGEKEKANEPVRQALKLRAKPDAIDYVGLAAVYSTEDGKVVFDRQSRGLAETSGKSQLVGMLSAVSLAKDAYGDEAAVEFAADMHQRADSVNTALALAMAKHNSGDTAGAAELAKGVLAKVKGPVFLSHQALAMALAGQNDEAVAMLDKISTRPCLQSYTVKAVVLDLTGDADGAAAAVRDLKRVFPEQAIGSLDLLSKL